MNFFQSYLRFIRSRQGNGTFGKGPLGFYLELFAHIFLGVMFFTLTQEAGKWILTGWMFLGYATIQSYAWLWWYPYQEYRRPIDDFERKVISRKGKALRSAASAFCADVATGGGKPARAAGALVDVIIDYYALLRAAGHGLATFQVMVDEHLRSVAQDEGVNPIHFVVYSKKGSPVPSKFEIQMNLKNGERFKFERSL
ncbi:MAG: hypothetical protein WD159_00100 [Patescibacteria group bacterium]